MKKSAFLKLLKQKTKNWFPSHIKTASAYSNVDFQKFAYNMGVEFSPKSFSKKASFAFLRKIKDLTKFLQENNTALEHLKAIFNIKNVFQMPKILRKLAILGVEKLREALDKAFSHWPLKIFTLPEAKVFEVAEILKRIMEKYPKINNFFQNKVVPTVDFLEQLLRKHLPTFKAPILTAIFIYIWLASAEMEWNARTLTDILAGRITLAEFLSNMPSAGFGFIANIFGPAFFFFLPISIALRVLSFMSYHYVVWDGQEFVVKTGAIAKDFKITFIEPLVDLVKLPSKALI